jgi:hypothetical protein
MRYYLVGGGSSGVDAVAYPESNAEARKHGRLVVVIELSEQPAATDPAQRTEAHHLIDMLRETADNFFVPDAAALARNVADQIEQQVGPKLPPKPEEPTRLYARVEDDKGSTWVRTAEQASVWRRESRNRAGYRYLIPQDGCEDYAGIRAVRVLSHGVTDEAGGAS